MGPGGGGIGPGYATGRTGRTDGRTEDDDDGRRRRTDGTDGRTEDDDDGRTQFNLSNTAIAIIFLPYHRYTNTIR